MQKLRSLLSSVKLCSLLVIIVLLAGVVGFSGCKNAKSKEVEVDLSKYIKLDIQGRDTEGTAKITFDSVLLMEDLLDDPDKGKYFEEEDRKLENLIESITIKLSKTSSLSNGDTLSYDVEFDEDRAEDLKIVFLDLEDVTVEGLKVPAQYNPFDDVTITYSGVSPFIEVDIEFNSSLEKPLYVTFKTDKKIYAKGEAVIVTASYDKYDAEQNSFVIVTQTEKEYIAEAEYEFVLQPSQVVDKTELYDYIYGEVWDYVTNTLGTNAQNFYIGLDLFSVYGYGGNYYTGTLAGDITVDSAYLLTIKMDKASSSKKVNEVAFIFKVPVIFTDIDSKTVYQVYIYAKIPNVQLDANGELFVAYSKLFVANEYRTTLEATYDNIVTDNVSNYEITEIPVADIPAFTSVPASTDPATATTPAATVAP